MLSMNEKELIEGALKGKPASQRGLFDRYAPTLMAVCLRYCKTRTEAEDALQESFMRIFDKLGQYNFQGSFEGWVRRLCVNVCLRTYQRKRATFEQSGLETIPESAMDPTAFSRLGEQELLDMVASLPEGYRIVFNLYAIEGYSHKEIGEALGIQEASSRSQLLKARKLLQQKIKTSQRIAI
ncbi:MAG: sigma-70 family RNA polymerase sigma factor [Bacteroidota bacterium]